MEVISKYITSKMHTIPGYLTQSDARIWQILMEAQSNRGVTGNLAEIGIYFGRSFFLLDMLKRDREHVWGCDLFTVEKSLRGKSSHYDAFLEHANRIDSNFSREHVFQCDSASLDDRLVGDLRAPVRFFSIDGGHLLEHLRTDCRIALQLLHPQGIIAFDDFCTPQWPEVTEGIFEFLDQNPDYKIFAISRKKAYAASVKMMEPYMAVITDSDRLKKTSINFTQFRGNNIPFINEGYRSILSQKANDTFGFGLLPVV